MEFDIHNLQDYDVIIFKNGETTKFFESKRYILEKYYDENLVCLNDDGFSIVAIYRPHYEKLLDTRNEYEQGRRI